MEKIGELESVWRYPVKSMRGEQVDVAMRKNDVLSKRDLEQGYVLLCQSIPLSDDVWVDCDV